jgi:hypothetical protein
MRRLGLTVARVASAGWVGAVSLFVVIAVREVRNPGLDSTTKDVLALLRFPAYYLFGFALVSLALAGTICNQIGGATRRKDVLPPNRSEQRNYRAGFAAGFLAVALATMGADHLLVYRPIVGMITPAGRARPAEFQFYHRVSIWLNVCHVGLCGVAAILLSWPRRE